MRAIATIAGMSVIMTASLAVCIGDAADSMDPEKVSRGAQVYAMKKCGSCHAIASKGGKIGPDLTQVGTQREVQWLKKFLIDPRSIVPKGKQPPFKGTDEELDELVTYLSSLR